MPQYGPIACFSPVIITDFTKVERTLQDIRSGNFPDSTRPTTTFPDRMRFQNGDLFLPA